MREPFLEFFRTFLFSNGSVPQVLLSTGDTSAPGAMGVRKVPECSLRMRYSRFRYTNLVIVGVIGVMLCIYVAGDSGGFLNPALTFAFCLYRKLPWRRFPIYTLAQLLGGFYASGVVYAN